MGDDFDVDAFLTDYRRRAEEVVIYGRQDLAAEHARLESELADVAASGQDDADGHVDRAREVSARMAEIEAEVEASAKVWRIEAIPQEDWHKLVIQHPPSDEDRKQSEGRESVAPSFWPAAVSACAVSPTVTVETAKRLPTVLGAADWDRLRLAAQRCNEEVTSAPKSQMGGAVRRLLAESSKPPKASRGRSGTAAKGGASRRTTTAKKAG